MKPIVLGVMVAAAGSRAARLRPTRRCAASRSTTAGVPRGIGLYGDVGFPNDEAGGGTGYAATGRAGFGAFGVTAILSSYNPDGPADSELSVGATVNYRVFGGPLVPLAVTLQAGVGYAKPETGSCPTTTPRRHRPAVPDRGRVRAHHSQSGARHPAVARAAARYRAHVGRRVSTRRPTPSSRLSGGLELNLLNGFGVHAAYDAIFADGGTPGVFGIGAHYNFRVPGL